MPAVLTSEIGRYNGLYQILYGVVIIGIVLGLNSLVIVKSILFFKNSLQKSLSLSRLRANLLFIMSTQFMALAQLGFIALWAGSLILIGLLPDWESSLRLSASSYTTMGIFTVELPINWQLIPTFIAFSGLFSFAWAATSTISMLSLLTAYLDKLSHPSS